MALPSSLLLSLQILLFLATRTWSEDIPLTSCGYTNYTAGSLYESNLHSLITELTLSTWNSSYSTATVGSSTDAQVFGLAQCRPDASAATCVDCLNSSATAAAEAKGCPLRKSAAFRAEHCVLRYSDQPFLSILDMSPPEIVFNGWTASKVFTQTVNALIDTVSSEASKAERRFGNGNAYNYSQSSDIHVMAWCTQDLSSSDCQQCLNRTAGQLPDQFGGQAMTVNCITRFENYSFLSVLPPPPPLQQSQTPPLPLQQSQTPPSTAEDAPRPTPAAVEGGNSGNGKDGQSDEKFSGLNFCNVFFMS